MVPFIAQPGFASGFFYKNHDYLLGEEKAMRAIIMLIVSIFAILFVVFKKVL
jgi:hypothetical protein